ncbi:hypothetical protein CU097_003382 [Rhizopus azygosporus]|uniref:RRM domain-containing protein n=1 Tax=Rhizopus azygosporus TaxID=86630 RepID=A0A367K330_RHIAZ|nr:hypothetical protein CU097_003382 [Rhizopus azygosporus]
MTTTVATLSDTQPTAPVRLVMNEQSFENRVFVGNLSFKTTKESLTAFAEKSGKILETIIIKRRRRHLGYGFITFEKEEEAKRAAKDLNKKELDGREINVEVARPKSELPSKRTPKVSSSRRKRRVKKVNKAKKEENSASPNTTQTEKLDRDRSKTTIFVANLPFTTKEEDLKELFKDYKVASVYVVRMRKGRSRGYGFVEFENDKEQKKAIENMKDVTLEGRSVYLKVAYSRQERNENKEKAKEKKEELQEDKAKEEEKKEVKVIKEEKKDEVKIVKEEKKEEVKIVKEEAKVIKEEKKEAKEIKDTKNDKDVKEVKDTKDIKEIKDKKESTSVKEADNKAKEEKVDTK